MNLSNLTKMGYLGVALLAQSAYASPDAGQTPSTTEQLATAEQTIGLKGHVYGVDGKPMKYAVVKVTPITDKTTTIMTPVGKDGSYALKFDKQQRYALTFTGVAHLPLHVMVDYSGQKSLKMDVELDHVPVLAEPKKVSLLLFTDIEEGKDTPKNHDMEKLDNGHYRASIDLPAGSIKYKFDGLAQARYQLGNADSAQFELGKWNDFHSIDQHPGGLWTIDIKPIEPSQLKAKTPVALSGDWQAQLVDVQLQAKYNRLQVAQRVAKIKAKDADFVFDAGLTEVAKWRATYANTAYETEVLAMSTAVIGQNSDIYEKAIRQIDGDSWLWHLPRVSFEKSLSGSIKSDSEVEEYSAFLNQLNAFKPQVERFLKYSRNDAQKARLVVVMAYSYRATGDKTNYQKYYSYFKSHFSTVGLFSFYNKMLAPKKLGSGMKAPAFSIAALQDTKVQYDKSSFSGKVYLLDFWATWCTPCLKEMPILHQTYERFKGKGFEILSLSADDAVSEVVEFRQGKWSMPWKHAFLLSNEEQMTKAYFVFGYPSAYLIDERGYILASGDKVRGHKLEQTLADYYSSIDASKNEQSGE